MEMDMPYEFIEVGVEDAVATAMKEFNSVMAGENDDLLAEKQSAIMEMVRKQAEAEAKLNHQLAPLVTKEADVAEIEAVMSSILPEEEIQMIKDSLLFETYDIQVYTCSKSGPNSFVNFYREGTTVFPSMILDSSSKILDATWFQWASIVIECFALALSAIGIRVSFNHYQMQKICKSVEKVIRSSAFRKAMIAFKSAWSRGGAGRRARAIFDFMKDSYSAGIFWQIMKAVLSTMSWWDYTKAVASVTVTIVAAFFTGGAALIAKILLAMRDAYKLVQKMMNLKALERIQIEHTESLNKRPNIGM